MHELLTDVLLLAPCFRRCDYSLDFILGASLVFDHSKESLECKDSFYFICRDGSNRSGYHVSSANHTTVESEDVPLSDGDLHERWLPVWFDFHARPRVHWINFSDVRLSAPFFNQTIRQLRLAQPVCTDRTTTIDELFTAAHALPLITPAGVIFHISRCGSTLLANALRTGYNVLVLSEARPVVSLLTSHLSNYSPVPNKSVDRLRKSLLDAVLALYADAFASSQARVVLKCCAANTWDIETARLIWPSTPAVVIVREPIEVMISNLDKPAGWLRHLSDPVVARSMLGPMDNGETFLQECCARGIGSLCKTAAAAIDENCRVVDYAHLNRQVALKIGSYFGIDMPATTSPALTDVFGTYSKDPHRLRPYVEDREAKHARATSMHRALIETWAQAAYLRLRELEVNPEISS